MSLSSARWALLAGNFAIGCGVMVVPGSLNSLVASLQVSAAVAGQLITAGAVAMGCGAPLLAMLLGSMDRRLLLTASLAWYAIGHAVCALVPGYAALLPLRALAVLAAAVFTPQAAAAINVMAPEGERGRHMSFIFLGWSLASVLGMPLHAWIGESFGWRWAFALVAVLAAAAAWGVWRTVPDGVKPPPMSLGGWGRVLRNPWLMALVGVTVLSGAGQFTLFSYMAPYYRDVLGASAGGISFLFMWFGLFGLVGNVLLTRWIERLGAPRCVNLGLVGVGLAFLAWPWAGSLALAALLLVPWALGTFSSNSAQQARLSAAAPAVAPALLALNTSAIYAGQALGAAGGGAILAAGGYGPMAAAALAWVVAALVVSLLLARKADVGRVDA
ncbi:MAG: MFS transporter [Burkholderiaceae bacterium]|jgi:predicted MFS family arabinose efflux permease|nr:MFS transporter [Burkholderiaceae bacterium]